MVLAGSIITTMMIVCICACNVLINDIDDKVIIILSNILLFLIADILIALMGITLRREVSDTMKLLYFVSSSMFVLITVTINILGRLVKNDN